MSPLEVNKKIAEVKLTGMKWWFEFTEDSISAGREQPIIRYRFDVSINQKTIPIPNNIKSINWAGNILDAWQLFEENPEVYLKKGHYTDGTIVYQCVFRDSNLNVIGGGKAATAPMAIALAWLAWKENK